MLLFISSWLHSSCICTSSNSVTLVMTSSQSSSSHINTCRTQSMAHWPLWGIIAIHLTNDTHFPNVDSDASGRKMLPHLHQRLRCWTRWAHSCPVAARLCWTYQVGHDGRCSYLQLSWECAYVVTTIIVIYASWTYGNCSGVVQSKGTIGWQLHHEAFESRIFEEIGIHIWCRSMGIVIYLLVIASKNILLVLL